MVRIITDSTCDLPHARREALGIEVVPLSVHFGAEDFLDGETITSEAFYRRLRTASDLPTTSQVNPEEFVARFQRHLEAGDQVVGLFLASQLSGTCQSASIAAGIVGGADVHVIDSGSVTFGLGLLVETACLLRDAGKSAAEIAQQLRDLLPRIRLLAVVDTLKFLKMGGRISGAAAVVGGMLGITPILKVQDGVVLSPHKTRGRKAAFAWMDGQMAREPVDTTLPVAFGHADAEEAMAATMDHFLPQPGAVQVVTGDIGSVVGTHAGPGAAGIAYFASV